VQVGINNLSNFLGPPQKYKNSNSIRTISANSRGMVNKPLVEDQIFLLCYLKKGQYPIFLLRMTKSSLRNSAS